jgi:Cell Wall Hydrolase
LVFHLMVELSVLLSAFANWWAFMSLQYQYTIETARSEFSPVQKAGKAILLASMLCAIGISALVAELSRSTSKLGWAARNVHDKVVPLPRIDGLRNNPAVWSLTIRDVDVDVMTRTVIGEAAREGEAGKLAVIHVMLNRARKNVSWYGGNTVSSVALHKSVSIRGERRITTWQFEPWMSRRDYLWTISRESPLYKHSRRLVLCALNGDVGCDDPTDGATHFLEPNIVRLRSGTLPKWASNNGIRIGNHVFFKH